LWLRAFNENANEKLLEQVLIPVTFQSQIVITPAINFYVNLLAAVAINWLNEDKCLMEAKHPFELICRAAAANYNHCHAL